jgi:hypothetical protein
MIVQGKTLFRYLKVIFGKNISYLNQLKINFESLAAHLGQKIKIFQFYLML